MKMNVQELKQEIMELTTHTNFIYDNKEGVIDPLSHNHFELCFDGETKTYTSIDDVLSDKFLDGKSINEICGDMEFV